MQQVEEITRLFEGIRAVRDDGPRHILAGEHFFELAVQIPHVLRSHARRGDVGKLDEFKRGDLAQARHRRGQVFAGAGRHQAVLLGVVLHGDRAARSDNHNLFVNHLRYSLQIRLITLLRKNLIVQSGIAGRGGTVLLIGFFNTGRKLTDSGQNQLGKVLSVVHGQSRVDHFTLFLL